MDQISRRDLVRAGLTAATGLVVLSGAGCQQGRPSARLPGPVWPDEEIAQLPPATTPRSAPIGRNTPAPAPTRPTTVRAATGQLFPRSAWTSAQPNSRAAFPADPMNGVNRITVHHDGNPPVALRSRADIASRIEGIRRAHARNGWADIGYHYIVDPMGNVWEGRPLRLQGAHVKDTNEHNLGVLVLGNFDLQQPTPQALASLDSFVAAQMRRFRVPMSRVYTHQELRPTACPGRNLQRYMLATRARSGRMASA